MNNSINLQSSNISFQKNPYKLKKTFTKLQLMQHYTNQYNRFHSGKITENEFFNKTLKIMAKIGKIEPNQKTLKTLIG